MQFVSGMVVAVGGLVLLMALYLQFFDIPGKSDSEDDLTQLNGGTIAAGTKAAPRVVAPITVTNIKPREALAPSLKMFAGAPNVAAASSQSKKLKFNVIGKSGFPPDTEFEGLPKPQRFTGQVIVSTKPSTSFKIDNRSQQPDFFPPETIASGLRLPEGLYMVPLAVIQYADFTTVFDGDNNYDLIPTRIMKKGNLAIFRSLKRPDFPRVIASDAGALNENTKGVSLIWVDRNSEIHILENLDAIGLDPESNEVTFELPNDSVGGVIVDDAGRIAAIVSSVKDGIGTVRQMSTVLIDTHVTAREVLDFSRLPVSKDKAGKLQEAAACLVQVHSKRKQLTSYATFESKIEASRENDETSKELFNDQFEVNFTEAGQIVHFSMTQGTGYRLPGFLGYPAMASIVEFPATPGKTEWQVKKLLELGTEGNELILVPKQSGSNELQNITQTDDYRILEDTADYLTIERKYIAKSASTQADQKSPIWEIPAGFPFQVEGKFTYRYDKALKLATSVTFEGVEQKQVSEDLVLPLSLSFKMEAVSEEDQQEQVEAN